MFSRLLDNIFPSRVYYRNRLKELKEDRKFNNYMRSVRKEHDRKYPNAKMACGVSKCQVGRYWTEQDYCILISAIKEGVTMESLSRASGRSYVGIYNRLKMLGLVKWCYGRDLWQPVVKRRKITTYHGNKVDIKNMLISVGYIDKGTYLKCPEWLSLNELNRGF